MKQYRVYFPENASAFAPPGLRARDVPNTHVPVIYITAATLAHVKTRMMPGEWCPAHEARELLRSKGIGVRFLGLECGDVVEDVGARTFHLRNWQGFTELPP